MRYLLSRVAFGGCLALLMGCVTNTPAPPGPPGNDGAVPTATADINAPTATPAAPLIDATRTLPPLPTSTTPATASRLSRTIALPIVSGGGGITPTAEPAKAVQTATVPTLEPLPKINLREEGINVADYSNMALPTDLGFGWVQVFNPPEYPINGFKIIYRVPLGKAVSGQQADIDDWADGLESLARERRGVINAYAIGNEVNLSREWGGQQPDPWVYVRILAAGYARVKQSDPDAIVVSSGIAPTGGDGDGFVDDLRYARAMFEAGALDVIDAYGFHPYGFAYEPEHDPADTTTKGLLFRRAEAHRALMEEFGGTNKQIWATEFGWLVNPDEEGVTCALGGLDWQRVSRSRQAAYVVRAYDYASKNWPWMGPMFLWNHDFSRSPLYPEACEQMKWFSMLDLNGNERPIVEALRRSRP